MLGVQPVREFDGAALGGCAECTDFAALGADLAVGNPGSPGLTSTESQWNRDRSS